MAQVTVERSIWIAAPRERVWQAITDPAELAQWLLPPALGARMKRDEPGTLYVCMGDMEIPIAILEALDPPRRVTSRGLPDRLIVTTYTLEEENGGTRLTVTMAGFESLPADARQDRLAPSGTGWERALANLKAYVAGTELPFPEGYVAALFGYRREARQTFAVERSIWIDASRERVWRAIADPKRLQLWFSPATSWELSALEVGGRLYVHDAATDTDMYVQVIEHLDPPHQLVLRTEAEPPDTPYVTTYTLEEERGGTRLTVTHSGYELVPDESRWSNMEQNAFGFGMMLENVQAHVEGKSLPYPGGF
ncbi:MAG TPA: SRPBCC domain-containing protein [Ardenticatenaceae bacterium]|nr:SRPBCC domain-containing protein [Ardenticatenaceae bacterium]